MIVGLNKLNLSQRVIARRVNRSKTAVYNVLQGSGVSKKKKDKEKAHKLSPTLQRFIV